MTSPLYHVYLQSEDSVQVDWKKIWVLKSVKPRDCVLWRIYDSLGYCPITVRTYRQKPLKDKEGRVYSGAQVEGPVRHGGRAWQQEHETGAHIASTVWKQIEVNSGSLVQDLSTRNNTACFHGGSFLPQLNKSRNFHSLSDCPEHPTS